MTVTDIVKLARRADASAMADLADAKRGRYAEHAFPFQRPAERAREIHEPFLASLTDTEGFIVLVHQAAGAVDGFLVARLGAAPPPFGEGPHVHVDDYVVSEPGAWPTAGRKLLEEATRRAASFGAARAIVVSGPRSIDAPKNDFLTAQGFVCEAEWWVRPITPSTSNVPDEMGFRAALGPAPPVYDPGGPTCLALSIDGPECLGQLEKFASAAGSVIVVVPTTTDRADLRHQLSARGYTVASEWFTKAL